jgi:hypothetical protein
MKNGLKIAALVLLLAVLWACGAPGHSKYINQAAYNAASPENRERINQGRIGVGMSIYECMAAWPDKTFEKISEQATGKGSYETWRVESFSRIGGGMVWLWLFVEDGRITMIDERRKHR